MVSSEIKRISFIGFGNVGSTLAKHFQNQGIQIKQVLLQSKRAIDLAGVEVIDQIENLEPVDLLFVCVNDDAIPGIASQIPENQAFATTSGSIGLDVLGYKNNHCVFYPLQSFANLDESEVPKIPILLESKNEKLLDTSRQLAQKCFQSVEEMNSQCRFHLHLAAVFANNFTNHLIHIAQSLCKEREVDFKLLLPLIAHTSKNWQNDEAIRLQTGPAVRNDLEIIQKHLGALSEQNQYLYRALTESIQKEKRRLWKITNND